MRTELNLVNIDRFICFQDLDKLYPKWLKPHKLHINHSLMTICRFFQCHSRYFSYSFLVSTSTQSWRSEGPQGPKARPLGTPSLVQTGRKISRNVVFPETSPEKRLIIKDVCVFCNVLLQKRWLGFPKKNGRSEGSISVLRTTSGSWGSSAQQLLEQCQSVNGVALRKKKHVATSRIGMIQLNPTGSGAAPLRPWILSSAQWRMTCCYMQKCRNASCPDDPSCLEFCCLIFVLKCGAANCAMQGETNVSVPNEPQR